MTALSKDKLKIMIVDDSVTVRGMLRLIIEAEENMEVVTTAINGAMAVQHYKNYKPDIVLMDIEMPEMNGLEALSEILKMNPAARVVMCSSLTQKGAAMTLQALQIGAFECLAKPTTTSIDRGDEFKMQLIRLLNGAHQNKSPLQDRMSKIANPAPKAEFKLKKFSLLPFPTAFYGSVPQVLAIGSSTGGPMVLTEVINNLTAKIDIPVFITQHMPAGFTKILAKSLAKSSGHDVVEAEEGMRVKKKQIYIAPGGRHMEVRKEKIGVVISLSDASPVQYCKPSVDVMLESLIEVYQTNLVAVILTGMGEDGLRGARKLIEASPKNILIAQDETTSIVWGMPGAVAMAGICHDVIPMSNIAPALNKLLNGQKP